MALIPLLSFSQNQIKGRIIDQAGKGVPFANVFIESLSKGVVSDDHGSFTMDVLKDGEYELTVSIIGYKDYKTTVKVNGNQTTEIGVISIKRSNQVLEEVVVSGSKRMEKITESPVTINVLNTRQLDKFVGSPTELLAQQKGVDVSRTGAFYQVINARGFNSAFNPKMLQLDDNRISSMLISGLPMGVQSPVIKEDIERIEVVLGPSSALYGPNSLNGLINTVTKSPYDYQGTNLTLGAGTNKLLSTRLRHADVVGKWAYKVTGEYTQGRENEFTDSVIFDVHTYVPQVPAGAMVISQPEKYLEKDVSFAKGSASVFYRPNEDTEIGFISGGSISNYVMPTNIGRTQYDDYKVAFMQLKLTTKNWFAQVYNTWTHADLAFNLRNRTINTSLIAMTAEAQGIPLPDEKQMAKMSLEGPLPANYKDNSQRLNAELQYNNQWGNLDLVVGTQYQRDLAGSDGTVLLDEDGPVEIQQLGVYSQLQYDFGESGFKAIAAARGDYHNVFDFNILPKAGITYSHDKGTWRITYGKGFATPTVLNTHMKIMGGIGLGNADGFTKADGSKVDPLRPETVQTFEVGYKGHLAKGRLFIDVNAYYNKSKDFLSPLLPVIGVTHKGDKPLSDFTQIDKGYILTYFNYGNVDTYGSDIGFNYYINDNMNIKLNYSFFDYKLDTEDINNDGNGDGKVTQTDLPINTSKNKISITYSVNFGKFYGSVMTRFVQKYDFFSGNNVSAATNEDLTYGGDPVVEGQRVGVQWNYGPLGGTFLSINTGYKVWKHLDIGVYANNLIGAGNFEFVASPPAYRMYGLELKMKF